MVAPRPRSSRAAATAATEPAAQVLSRLNEHLRSVIFPAMFERLSFDHICEVEYCFHVDKETHVMQVTKTFCFFSPDRNSDTTLLIEFAPADSKRMGAWISHIIPHGMERGIVGFTNNQETVEHKLGAGYESAVTRVIDRASAGMGV